jgi:prepilin-type N-terminal cleavage/methylation domain-containing protein/prepilin-type processing-associated H-X9-DG protein
MRLFVGPRVAAPSSRQPWAERRNAVGVRRYRARPAARAVTGLFGGFTLIELLVVIAVIAVLAALLLGVAGPVLAGSRSATCVNNLRQIYIAAVAYESDTDQPFCTFNPAPFWDWSRVISTRYNYSPAWVGVRPMGVLACPESKYIATNWPADYGKTAVVNRDVSATIPLYPTIRMMVMNERSKVFLIADCWAPDADPNKARGRDLTPFQDGGLMHFRHRNKANVLFYDGHVDALEKSEVPKWTTARKPPWQPPQ